MSAPDPETVPILTAASEFGAVVSLGSVNPKSAAVSA
jgi:hypothetical protein